MLLNEAKQQLDSQSISKGRKFSSHTIARLDDIFSHADGLKEVVGRLVEG